MKKLIYPVIIVSTLILAGCGSGDNVSANSINNSQTNSNNKKITGQLLDNFVFWCRLSM